MDDIADLQAQLVALRLAVEGAWLSLLSNDADPVAQQQLSAPHHHVRVRCDERHQPSADAALACRLDRRAALDLA